MVLAFRPSYTPTYDISPGIPFGQFLGPVLQQPTDATLQLEYDTVGTRHIQLDFRFARGPKELLLMERPHSIDVTSWQANLSSPYSRISRLALNDSASGIHITTTLIRQPSHLSSTETSPTTTSKRKAPGPAQSPYRSEKFEVLYLRTKAS
ncbi:hypothetical protein N7537_001979 [Penicillium hordei]|uniref:Uncharacterized protein n=1 Tax=Penicillium hordei TaxID=40994 RepID=A0AAD6EGL4_9EURO|nr:uncharacterized protein N7537_001979 [Penicillium hordei]KAJ5616865.1 hypothetical protein N7537_001979 [Penicillium hordei]